jgi:hypothetical protein
MHLHRKLGHGNQSETESGADLACVIADRQRVAGNGQRIAEASADRVVRRRGAVPLDDRVDERRVA